MAAPPRRGCPRSGCRHMRRGVILWPVCFLPNPLALVRVWWLAVVLVGRNVLLCWCVCAFIVGLDGVRGVLVCVGCKSWLSGFLGFGHMGTVRFVVSTKGGAHSGLCSQLGLHVG